jgi:hypothetical protein
MRARSLTAYRTEQSTTPKCLVARHLGVSRLFGVICSAPSGTLLHNKAAGAVLALPPEGPALRCLSSRRSGPASRCRCTQSRVVYHTSCSWLQSIRHWTTTSACWLPSNARNICGIAASDHNIQELCHVGTAKAFAALCVRNVPLVWTERRGCLLWLSTRH